MKIKTKAVKKRMKNPAKRGNVPCTKGNMRFLLRHIIDARSSMGNELTGWKLLNMIEHLKGASLLWMPDKFKITMKKCRKLHNEDAVLPALRPFIDLLWIDASRDAIVNACKNNKNITLMLIDVLNEKERHGLVCSILHDNASRFVEGVQSFIQGHIIRASGGAAKLITNLDSWYDLLGVFVPRYYHVHDSLDKKEAVRSLVNDILDTPNEYMIDASYVRLIDMLTERMNIV